MEGKGPLSEQSHIEDETKILKEGEKMQSLYNPCGKVIKVELLRLPRSLKSYSFVGGRGLDGNGSGISLMPNSNPASSSFLHPLLKIIMGQCQTHIKRR